MTIDRFTTRVWAADMAPALHSYVGVPRDRMRLLEDAELDLTLSEAWSPYVRATVKTPWSRFPLTTTYPESDSVTNQASLDPRGTPKKFVIRVDQHFATDENSLAAWTKALPIGAWAGGAHASQSYLVDSTGVEVARNIGINPLCAAGGAGISSNSAAAMPITRGITLPTPTPDGITTGARITRTATSPSVYAVSSYSIDGLANVRPVSMTGAWVMVTAAGYRAAISSSTTPAGPTLTAGVWTWITTTAPTAANAHLGLVVTRTSGANASTSVITYVTGVTTIPGSVAPTRAIHGGITRTVAQMTRAGLPRIASTWPTWYEGTPKDGKEITAITTLDDTNIDLGRDTITLSLVGDEMTLHDSTNPDDVGITGFTLRYAINDLLARTKAGSLYECPDRDADALMWRGGASAWDAASSWIGDVDHVLMCDELGRWRVHNRASTGRPVHTWPAGDLIAISQDFTRARDWFAHVRLRYQWTTHDEATGTNVENEFWIWNGAGWITSDSPVIGLSVTNPSRVLYIDRRVTRKPTHAEAVRDVSSIYRRVTKIGSALDIERPADLTPRPLDTVHVTGIHPTSTWWHLASRNHAISAVTWRFPANTMTITTRGSN